MISVPIPYVLVLYVVVVDNMLLTMVTAMVFALVAGGFLIVTRTMERMMARTMREICAICTRCFHRTSNERIAADIVGSAWMVMAVAVSVFFVRVPAIVELGCKPKNRATRLQLKYLLT